MLKLHDFFLNTLTGSLYQKPFIGAIIGAVSNIAGGVIGGRASQRAAEIAAGSRDVATAEQRRQFNITQGQMEPFRAAGERGLSRYEEMMGQQGPDIPSNIPAGYRSTTQVPDPYQFESGDYRGLIESDLPEDFDYSTEDFMGSAGRTAREAGGMEALARRGVSGYGLEDLSSNLANKEYTRSRGRAYEDYLTGVAREEDRYGRSVDEYGRQTGREATLYGRGRQSYLDEAARERELDRRSYLDYTTGVGREEEQYRRGVERYGREYVDPLSRYAELAGIGQSTTTGLGQLRQNYAGDVAANTASAGRIQAAGEIGRAGAYSQAASGVAQNLADYWSQ